VKKLSNLVLVLAAAAGAILFIGFLRPPEATTRCQVIYRKPVKEIWPTIVDFEKWPEWNPNVERIEPAADKNDHPVWTLRTSSGRLPMEVAAVDPFAKLETLIETSSAQSRWSWVFRNVPAGTELTITQRKTVTNPFLRGIAVFHDEAEPIEQAMIGLGRRHELTVEPKALESVE